MKKKVIAMCLIIILSTLPIYSTSVELNNYEEYTIDEFPSWSQKLRRGESLFFGSLAITFPLSVLSYNLAVNSSLISSSSSNLTDLKYEVTIAAILSLSIALGDYILGEME